jgi:hypothetical protein
VACTYADDTYLTTVWPGVVVRTGERWLVVVDAAQAGTYTVTMGGLPFEVEATGDDTTATIRASLVASLGGQVLAAVSPQGLTGLLLQEMPPAPPALPSGLAVVATGPADGTITATLVSGGDTNATARTYWLEQVKCSLPPCCVVTCVADYTAMHAALAAHWLYSTAPANIGQAGGGANDFERMQLGPASLSRGKSVFAASGKALDDALARTVPGQYFLSLRAKYIFPFLCA